jgi:hypothetical protein
MPGLGRNIGDAYIEVHSDMGPFRREVRAEARAAGQEAGQEFDRRLGDRLGNLNIGLGRLKGSRNDFLNIIGSIAGGFERLFGSTLREGFARVGSTIAGFGRTLAQGEGPLAGFGRALDKVGLSIGRLGGGGLDGLIVQLVAFSLSFQVLIGVAGPLASGISGLAAAFTALAVGVGGALAGGILALGPGLIALAGGVGALTLAFSDLSKEQTKVFSPLKDLLDEVRGSVQGALFANAGDQVNSLVNALRPLGGILTTLAGVFSDWATDVLSAIGPGGALSQSFNTIGTALPGLLRNTLDLVSGLAGGLTGLFAGATPGAERLFSAIARVVQGFSEWANSVRGQREINTFIQQAVDLLGTLWDLAKQVGTTLSNLWNLGGAATAQQILEGLVGVFQRLNASMSTPEGRQAVLDFFQNGVGVIQALGPVITSIINLFNQLDTGLNRIRFQAFLGLVAQGIGALTSFVGWVQGVNNNLLQMYYTVRNAATSLGNLGSRAAAAGQQFRTTLVNAFNAVANVIGPLVTRILSLRSPMELAAASGRRLREQLVTAFNGVVSAVTNFVGRVRNAMSTFGNIVSAAVSAAVGALARLAGQAAAALGRFASSVAQGVARAVSNLRQFASQAAAALGGLAGRFVGYGLNIMQGFYNGVVSGAGRVISYVQNLAGRVASAFANALGIASPSKLFAVFGGDIIAGLVNGMRRREKDAEKEGDNVAKAVINGAQTSLQKARGSIANTARIVTEALASAGENPRLDKAFKTLGTRVIRMLTDGLDNGREAAQGDIKSIIERISKVAQEAMKGEDAKTRKSIQNQAKALQQWVKGQGAALDAVWREVDRAGVRLDTAREKLKELQEQFGQLRDQFRDQLRGELNLGSSVGEDGSTTFEAVAANVSGLASKMRTFAGLLKQLVAAGLPAALVQEVASLGTTEGIAVARALLSGSTQQRNDLIADFASIQRSTSAIGTLLADQMFGAGIEAQKGLIKGLEANQKALIDAAKRIAKRITDEVKRELGIKSPSTVFKQIGTFITEGLAQGIEAGASRVNRAVTGLVDPNLVTNLNPGISSIGGGGNNSPAVMPGSGNIAAGAITVVTPYANPRLVALEVMDALAVRGK